MPSQREGQVDDDADHQSVRSTPQMESHLRPLRGLKAGKSRHPTVDGMKALTVRTPAWLGCTTPCAY
jgi:hypothetical protein